jgi:exodeoxyribonuclease VII small subunit
MATQPTPEPRKEPTFEERLDELNALITSLEGGELGLEASIATFEKGRRLHQELLDRLSAFERRIEILTKGADGADRVVPAPEFDPDRAPAAAPSPPPSSPASPRAAKKKPTYDDEVPF